MRSAMVEAALLLALSTFSAAWASAARVSAAFFATSFMGIGQFAVLVAVGAG